ncbi:mCG146113, partial [Mus musculus]
QFLPALTARGCGCRCRLGFISPAQDKLQKGTTPVLVPSVTPGKDPALAAHSPPAFPRVLPRPRVRRQAGAPGAFEGAWRLLFPPRTPYLVVVVRVPLLQEGGCGSLVLLLQLRADG